MNSARGDGDALAGEMGWSSTDNGENVIAFFRAFPRVSASGVRAQRRARADETSSVGMTRAREEASSSDDETRSNECKMNSFDA